MIQQDTCLTLTLTLTLLGLMIQQHTCRFSASHGTAHEHTYLSLLSSFLLPDRHANERDAGRLAKLLQYLNVICTAVAVFDSYLTGI